jgi:glycine cleavage system H protein
VQHPKEFKYTKEHEWARIEGDTATVGITWHAQDALGDVVYVELPKIGAKYKQMEEFGVVESVKTVSNLFCPVSGEVLAINPDLSLHPELVNQDPHGRGWIIKVKMNNPAEVNHLLSAGEYEASLPDE